jgi:glycosyltransferase involved in cell wall biosynthesis
MSTAFSIIIPTLNEEKYLPLLLDSLAKQRFQGKWEILVVDGESKDTTKKIAQAYKKILNIVTVISSKRGISLQRNIGAAKAKYNYFIFLDADTVLPEDFLSKVAKKINPREKTFVALPFILPIKGTFADYIFVSVAYFLFLLAGKFKPLVTGMCLITTKENHSNIHGFNEKIIYGEDMDYGFRSVKSGAAYHLYISIRLFTSPRRGRKIGRRNLAKLWISWYMQFMRKGFIQNQSVRDYPYGNY